MSNEHLMWLSIAIWVVGVGLLLYYLISGKAAQALALPSGNTSTS